MNDPVIKLENVEHFYGKGALRRQVLCGISTEIAAGEIVILTGPSGSGKTTLLTLLGALRSAQHGSLRILGTELNGASASTLQKVRRQIGYIFQAHNLLGALTASQNVAMSLYLQKGVSRREAKQRADAILAEVGLGEHLNKFGRELSGGQRQRVGIARALVSKPRIVLADEPTASLDRHSGREVVELMRKLAREQQVAVILVTHDNRILDIADRILQLEDGKMQSLSDAIAQNASQLLTLLERHDPNTSRFIAAFSSALARVAFADQHIAEAEREVMRRVLREVSGLSPAEVDLAVELAMAQVRIRGESRDEASERTFTAIQKDQFLAALYAVADADGNMSPEERMEIRQIAEELGFPADMASPESAGGG